MSLELDNKYLTYRNVIVARSSSWCSRYLESRAARHIGLKTYGTTMRMVSRKVAIILLTLENVIVNQIKEEL